MLIEDLSAGRRSRLTAVGLGLTRAEAKELRDSLDQLDAPGQHQHVSSADYQTEITVWLVENEAIPRRD